MTPDEFYALPTIASQLPITFRTGAYWDVMDGECAGCKDIFGADDLRGRITRVDSGNAYRGVTPASTFAFDMVAVGYCRPCALLTPFEYRFYEDMTMSSLRNDDRRWVPVYSLWVRFKRWCRGDVLSMGSR